MFKSKKVLLGGKYRFVSYPVWDDQLKKYLTIENLLRVSIIHNGNITSRWFVDFLKEKYDFECSTDEVRELFLNDLARKGKLIKVKSKLENIYRINPKNPIKIEPINTIICICGDN